MVSPQFTGWETGGKRRPGLPSGLEYLPGFDPEKGLVRLTTKLEITTDEDENPVGFLGRAHPLVRRALDRVRNLSFGGAAVQSQDPRAPDPWDGHLVVGGRLVPHPGDDGAPGPLGGSVLATVPLLTSVACRGHGVGQLLGQGGIGRCEGQEVEHGLPK